MELEDFAILSPHIDIFAYFQNAVILQPVDGFLFPTPEMRGMDVYVPFVISKPINKI